MLREDQVWGVLLLCEFVWWCFFSWVTGKDFLVSCLPMPCVLWIMIIYKLFYPRGSIRRHSSNANFGDIFLQIAEGFWRSGGRKNSTDHPPMSENQDGIVHCNELRKRCKTCCTATHPCHLCNIATLENTVALKWNCSLKRRISLEAEQLVRCILETIGGSTSLGQTNVHLRGSMSNDLKIGRPDEIDFLIELHSLSSKGCNEWRLERDSFKGYVDRMEFPNVGLEFCYQLQDQLPRGDSLINRHAQFMRPGNGHEEYLDAKLVKDWFSSEIEMAIQKIQSTDFVSSPTELKLHFTYDREKGILLLLQKYSNFAVKVDVTPCVRCVGHEKEDLLVVPSSRYNTWRPSNDNPEELKFGVVSQAIRVIKALRDLTEKQTGSFTTVSYFVLQEKSGIVATLPGLSGLITRHLATAFLKPITNNVPSYSIVGSVVQHYRSKVKQRNSPELVLGIRPDSIDLDPEDEHFLEKVVENQMGQCQRTNQVLNTDRLSDKFSLPSGVAGRNWRYTVTLTDLVMDVLADYGLLGPDGNALLAHEVDIDWSHWVLAECLSTAEKLSTPEYLERTITRDLPLHYDNFTPDPLDYMRQSGSVVRFDTLPGWQVSEVRSDYFMQWFLEHCGRGLNEARHPLLYNLSNQETLHIAVFQPEDKRLYDVHHSFEVPFKRVLEAPSVEECLKKVSKNISEMNVLKRHSLDL